MEKNRTGRSAILGACLVALIGCGGPTSAPPPPINDPGGGCRLGCQRGFLCQGQSCVLDPTGRWVVRVTSGSVAARNASGSSWDGDGSAPDPKVCLTINGSRSCTQTVQDSFAPSWDADFPPATATALQSGVAIEYIDADFSFDDPICSGTVAVSTANFTSASWGFVCQGGLGQVSALLIAQ